MSNRLEFKLKREVMVDKNLNPVGDYRFTLYGCVDSMWCEIIDISSYEEALDLISLDNIHEFLYLNLSDDELDCIQTVLFYNPIYHFFDKSFDYRERIKCYDDEEEEEDEEEEI